MFLIVAATLDFLIGDPWNWLHPVQVMGWIINQYTSLVFTYVHSSKNKLIQSPFVLRWLGVFLGLGLIIGSGLVGWLIVWSSQLLNPCLGLVLSSILLAACFCWQKFKRCSN